MITMADDIYATNLPPGYGAYAGYVNGWWPDYSQIAARNPGAYLLPIAVTASADATCLDIENGDAVASQAPAWCQRQFARGIGRPVLYSSVSNMPSVLSALSGAGITRSSVRLWSAHYTYSAHICGPYSCQYPGVPPMDGTQWTDKGAGLNGSLIDLSVLVDGFFGTAPPPPSQPPGSSGAAPWEENMMRQLPVLQQGASGGDVRTCQALCGARGHSTSVDGAFGPNTTAAVKAVQAAAHLVVDGVVGPATWPALMAV